MHLHLTALAATLSLVAPGAAQAMPIDLDPIPTADTPILRIAPVAPVATTDPPFEVPPVPPVTAPSPWPYGPAPTPRCKPNRTGPPICP